MRTHPIVEYYQALRDSAPCLSRAATLPKGTKLGLGKRRAPGNTIILSQPYRRRVSTDRLNREGSQLAASLEGEPGPTPAGKTLPHSFPETSRFRRERARDGYNTVYADSTATSYAGAVFVGLNSNISWSGEITFSSNTAETLGEGVMLLTTLNALWGEKATFVNNSAPDG